MKRAGEARIVEVMVDSGVVEVAAPPRFAQDHPSKLIVGSRSGAKYRTASVNEVANRAERKVLMKTETGEARPMLPHVMMLPIPLRRLGGTPL